jgi:hypothetical protein
MRIFSGISLPERAKIGERAKAARTMKKIQFLFFCIDRPP